MRPYLDGFNSVLREMPAVKKAGVARMLASYIASRMPGTTSPLDIDPAWRQFRASAPEPQRYYRPPESEWPERVLGPGQRSLAAGPMRQGFARNIIG